MPEVSVIIPVYDVERWLPACLDSVLAQTLADIEVICVDDCSPDGCAAILADYAARDKRIRVITLERNSGQGVARNVGLAAATGRYAYFLDSDDMVAPEALEELVTHADSNRLDILYFDSIALFETPELAKRFQSYRPSYPGLYPESVLTGNQLFSLFMEQGAWVCYVQRQLIRTDFLRENGIFFARATPHEDESFSFQAIMLAARTAVLRHPYFIRRFRTGSSMTCPQGIDDFVGSFSAFCIISRFMAEHGIASSHARTLRGRLASDARRLFPGKDITGEALERLGELGFSQEFLAVEGFEDSLSYNGFLDESVIEKACSARKAFIFGAGIVASNVFDTLAYRDVAIEGFLVSDPASNRQVLRGHHVFGVGEIPADPDALVVISVTDGYRAEIERLLDEHGWQHVFHRETALR